jgi:hypothetical protein
VTDHQVDLLSAWSTFGAAVLAAVASFFAYRAYVKESRIEKRMRDADERAQAALVAIWLGADPSGDEEGNWVVIRNASETPVYDVTWWIQLSSENVGGELIKVVPPSSAGEIFQPPLYLATNYGFEDDDLPELGIGLEFTDSAGIQWHRNTDGSLDVGGHGKTVVFPTRLVIRSSEDD